MLTGAATAEARGRDPRRWRSRRWLLGYVLVAVMLVFAPAAFGDISVTVNGTTLTVTGDSAANSIWVSCKDGNVLLSNGLAEGSPGYATYPVSPALPCATVTAVTVNGGEGDDTIDATGVSAAAFTLLPLITLNGGNGKDTIRGAEGRFHEVHTGVFVPTAVNGDGGDDPSLVGYAGATVTGGAGADSLDGYMGNDTVHTTLNGDAGDTVRVFENRPDDSLTVAGTLAALTVTQDDSTDEVATVTGNPGTLVVVGSTAIDASSSPRGLWMYAGSITGSPFDDVLNRTVTHGDGGNGSDSYIATPVNSSIGSLVIDVNDTGTSGTDSLLVGGTSAANTARISGGAVMLDELGPIPATQTGIGIEKLTVNLAGGSDAYRVDFDLPLPTVIISDTGSSADTDRLDFQCPADTSVPGVVTKNGQSASYAGIEQRLVCGPAPQITGFSPAAAVAGTKVTISGKNLAGATLVEFGTRFTEDIVSTTATKVVARVPGDADVGPISVVTPTGGTGTSTGSFRPLPKVTATYPDPAARAGDILVIQGSNLTPVNGIKLGTLPLALFNADSSTQIFAGPLPDSALTGPLTVTTPAGTSAAFTVRIRPTIDPLTVTVGAPGTPLTLTGKTFTGTKSVAFDGAAAAFKVVSATQLTTTVPTAAVTGPITVTNAGGATESDDTFHVPTHVTTFTPASGVAGTPVSISGTGLAGATDVKFGAVSAEIVSTAATKVVAKVPPGAPVGTIAVTTPEGTSTTPGSFNPVPKLTLAAPGPARVGEALTLTGSNLLAATALKLGSLPLSIANVDSATQLTTGQLPDGALTGPLVVSTPGGTSAGFTLGVRPTIDPLVVSMGAAGTVLTLTGKTFTGTKTVTFGGATAAFKVLSAAQLTVTVPTAAVTGPITVANAGGATLSDIFHVLPKVTAFTPASGVAGTAVSVGGTGLGGATDVSFGSVSGQIVSVTATKVVAKVPAGAPVGAIGVTTPEGTSASTGSFKPVPKLTSAAPGPARAGDPLTLTGSNLLAATALKLGTLPLTIASVDSATQITTMPLPDAALTGPLVVTTPGGASAGLTLGVRPTIDPLAVTMGAAGTVLTLTGKTFTGTRTVAFGSAAAAFKVVSATQLTTTVPTAATTGPITVTNAGGATLSDTFHVLPGITTLAPASAYPGTTVTINGTGLGGATAVKLNGKNATGFHVASALQITAVVAPGTTSGPVSVTTPEGTATSLGVLTIKPFVLRVNLPGFDVDSIDPSFAFSSPAWQLENATCAKLLDYPDSAAPAGNTLQPDVATALPVVSNGGTTYTFTIRPGFAFSPPSGQSVTAQTFKLGIERALKPGSNGLGQAYMTDVVGATDYINGTAATITGIVAAGDTVQVTLNAPAPDFLVRLALPLFCAVPTDAPAQASTSPIPSAGPYYVSSYTAGDRIVLDRNPNYGGTRTTNPDQIVFTVTQPTASVTQLLAGQADYQGFFDTANWTTIAKKVPKQTSTNPLQEVDYLALNTSRSIFSTVAARRAVNLVVNRTQLAGSRGLATAAPTDQYLPPTIPGFRDAAIFPLNGPTSAQLAQANSLVDQAGIRGQTVVLYTCNIASCTSRALLIKTALARIGLKTDIQQFAGFEVYARAGTRGEPFDMVDAGWLADYPDPRNFLNTLFDGSTIGPTGNNNLAYFDDPAYNQKLAAATLLAGSARDTAYGDLDIDLATNAAPWIAYDNRNLRDAFSARIGCQTYQPNYGIDLATLCVKP